MGQTLSIAGRTYTVVGVMEKKEFYFNSANGNALDWMNKFVFVPVTTMLNRMSGDRAGQKIAYMNVQVRDVKDMDKAMEEVATILRRTHGGVEDLEIVNREGAHGADGAAGTHLRRDLHGLRGHLAAGGRDRDHEHPAGLLQRAGARGGDAQGAGGHRA